MGAEVIRESGKLTKAATLESHALQDVRNVVAHWVLGLPVAQHAIAGMITELAIGYPKSVLNGPSDDGDAGARIAPVAGEPPYGATDAPRFSLRGSGEGATSLLSQFPTLLEPQLRAPAGGGPAHPRPARRLSGGIRSRGRMA